MPKGNKKSEYDLCTDSSSKNIQAMSQTDVGTEVEVHCLEMDKKQLNDLVSVCLWKLTLKTLVIIIRNGEARSMQKK